MTMAASYSSCSSMPGLGETSPAPATQRVTSAREDKRHIHVTKRTWAQSGAGGQWALEEQGRARSVRHGGGGVGALADTGPARPLNLSLPGGEWESWHLPSQGCGGMGRRLER